MNTEKELTKLTREFISIPSECKLRETYHDISLSVKAHMENHGIETRIVRFDADSPHQNEDITPSNEMFPHQSAFQWFSLLDKSNCKRDISSEKYNVVGEVGTGDFSLVLHAHMDTRCLGNESWQHPPFSGEVENGRIWGLGAADNKSGIALAITSVSEIKLRRTKVIFTFTADEECGGYTGMGYLTEILGNSQDLVISTNGPFYKVNVGCWGRFWAAISVEQVNSPENKRLHHILNENLYSMNKKLKKRHIPIQIASIDKTASGYIIVTCNTFSDNVLLSQLYSLLCEVAPQLDFGMKVLGTTPHVVSRRNPLFEYLSSAIENVLEKELPFQMGPISDIRFPLQRKVDAAAFGPIRKDSHVHKPDEHVRIEDLVKCVNIYQHFICTLDCITKR